MDNNFNHQTTNRPKNTGANPQIARQQVTQIRRTSTVTVSTVRQRQQPEFQGQRVSQNSKTNTLGQGDIQTTFVRKSNQGKPISKNDSQSYTKNGGYGRNNKPSKKPSKTAIAIISLILAGLLTVSILASILDKSNESPNTPNSPSVSSSQNYNGDNSSSDNNQPISPEDEIKVVELEDINPTFDFITWKGTKQLTIDDESMKQIIILAMRDAVDFYYDLEAPNCTFVIDEKTGKAKFDEKGKIISTTGKENFLDPKMNWQYYMGRLYQEVSFDPMVAFTNDIGRGADNPHGIFGSMPITTNDTLAEYFHNIFGVDYNFYELDSVITQNDIDNLYIDAGAKDVIKQKIYNMALKVTLDDIRKLKSMTKGHEELYLPYKDMTAEEIINNNNIDPSLHDEIYDIVAELKIYDGKYSPTLALACINALHLYGDFEDMKLQMANGKIFSTYFSTDYVKITMGNQDLVEQFGLQ